MGQSTNKRKDSQTGKLPITDMPVEETLLIKQRLRNLCELAIAIGQKQGLLGNHRNSEIADSEGGEDVTNKGNLRDREAALPGKNKAGDQGGEG
ncbi:MAG: hypothetical protein PHQ43_04970 [Dehalococcoidales bacterium]|nr:hypothetical protein [Dehalococcoidales bacterium]